MTDQEAKCGPIKRSIKIAGHATSITLEQAFWDGLKELAEDSGRSIPQVIGEIDRSRKDESLSGALRVAVLKFYRDRKPPT